MIYDLDKTNPDALRNWVKEIERNPDPDVTHTDIMQTVFAYFDISEHSKRNYLWELAYGYGHGFGLTEVIYYFEDMLPLIKSDEDCNKAAVAFINKLAS